MIDLEGEPYTTFILGKCEAEDLSFRMNLQDSSAVTARGPVVMRQRSYLMQ